MRAGEDVNSVPDQIGPPRVARAMDEPMVDGVNTYVVSEAAKRAGLTVVLSGRGGDELFFGDGDFRRRGARRAAAGPRWAAGAWTAPVAGVTLARQRVSPGAPGVRSAADPAAARPAEV